MNQSNTTGSYYFKVSRTTNTKIYLFPINIPIHEFFRVVKLHIMDDFGYQSIRDFELVLAGQQIDGIRYAEDVPAIDISVLTGTIYDNYGINESFYIRNLLNSNQSNNTQINNSNTINTPNTIPIATYETPQMER